MYVPNRFKSLLGDLTFASETIAPVMISETTKSYSEGSDLIFGLG